MNGTIKMIPQWRRWEMAWASSTTYENPLQEVALQVELTAPSGAAHTIDAFWDGSTIWRARFMPDEIGEWMFETNCSDTMNAGLHTQHGMFQCTTPRDETRFDRHGSIRVSKNSRYLEHADGTPFFWLSDTVWNGPLLSTAEEWQMYLAARVAQTFTAAQWVTTQWIASPTGDRLGELAYTGTERIVLNPEFFQRLDEKVEALNSVGLVSAPVLLWAARWLRQESENSVNPGLSLPEDQAILLVRYMVARWGGNHCLWILNGDGHYGGDNAIRWRNIGRGAFGGRKHAPVTLHPGGWHWVHTEFANEEWLDLWGYQSAHKLDTEALTWLMDGPIQTDWNKPPLHPIINLEPPYEYHNDMASNGARRITPFDVRRALYSSLLLAPTAGVSYGGHGVWGWDDGTTPPTAHSGTGVPLPWREALHMPAAEQLCVMTNVFDRVEWWRLRPAQALILNQLGNENVVDRIVAAQTETEDVTVIYTPTARQVELNPAALHQNISGAWVNPQTGERTAAVQRGTPTRVIFETPSAGDWLLILQ